MLDRDNVARLPAGLTATPLATLRGDPTPPGRPEHGLYRLTTTAAPAAGAGRILAPGAGEAR